MGDVKTVGELLVPVGNQEAERLRAFGPGPRQLPGVLRDAFRSLGTRVIQTPFHVPQATGVAERFVRTVRSECLDRLLILDQRHLERVLASFH